MASSDDETGPVAAPPDALRVGVDVGGTFTDVILLDASTGEYTAAKRATTPEAPEVGVMEAVSAVVDSESGPELGWFVHGTTVGLNALLTRTGAVVGLITTQGMRDVLEIARTDRADPYDLFGAPPPPLVPRIRRIGVKERMLATGRVHVPLDAGEVVEGLRSLQALSVEAIAVVFLNAHVNPAHELEAERVLVEAGFDGDISLSHRVSGEYREYERSSTTVIDAYIRPSLARYLGALEEHLRDEGVRGDLLLTRSGGGAMTFAEAAERPVESLMSGPVAGAEGAAAVARMLDLEQAVTVDVGGTSSDTCLIEGGRVPLMHEGDIEGMPVQTPWVDIRSVGAGGGSLAAVDPAGLLHVGPSSAGARPGPACYGRGGSEPTVTDAMCILGILGQRRLANGLELRRDLAAAAVEPLAAALDIPLDQVAQGVIRIAAANMANAIREITVERGLDPREMTLMPFGGAGPLFGTVLADELEMDNLVVPPYPGNFSAWGLLDMDLMRSRARSWLGPLDSAAIQNANRLLGEMYEELERSHGNGAPHTREAQLDLRYSGQEHSLTIATPVSSEGELSLSAQQVASAFVDEYVRVFGHDLDDAVELVVVRAAVHSELPGGHAAHRPTERAHDQEVVDAWSFSQGRRLPFLVMDRTAVGPEPMAGPLIVTEPTATTYVDESFRVTAGAAGTLLLSKAEA